MKKTKILTVLGVLLAMSITACGGGKSSETPKDSSQPAPSSQQGGGEQSSQGGGEQSSQGGGQQSSEAPHEHAYALSGEKVKNADNKDIYVMECSAKDDKYIGIAFTDYSELSPNKALTEGKSKYSSVTVDDVWLIDKEQSVKWNITVDKAITGAKLVFGITMTSSSHSDQGADESGTMKYSIKANNGEWADWNIGTKTYGDLGLDTGKRVYVEFGTIDLVAGENYIYLRQNNAGYRLLYGEEVRIHYTGDAKVSGEHTHVHQAAAGAAWEKDASKHWHVCKDGDGAKVDEAEHTWGTPVTVNATCDADGSITKECTVCHYQDVQVLKAEHAWGEAIPVAADAEKGTVAYNKYVCSIDGAIKIEVALDESMLNEGSTNKNDPAGYLKMKFANDGFGFKFDYDSNAMGNVYQRGVMDGWSTNKTRYVFKGADSGDFEMKVNGQIVDYSAQMSKKYEDVMLGEAQDGNLSPLTDVLTGAVVLVPGVNTFSYTRLASYNLALKAIVFIVENFTHEHQAATEWSSDDTQHWHACVGVGCPIEGYKMDAADHDWDEWVVDDEPSCSAEGLRHHECKICHKVVSEQIAKTAHTMPDTWTLVRAATCEAAGEEKRECEVCHEVETRRIAKLDHSYGGAVNKYAAGEGYIATTSYNCELCHKAALRWSALDYDTTDSKFVEKNADNVRFNTGSSGSNGAENKGQTDYVGPHLIYKVNVAAAQEHASLAFKIKNTSGTNGTAPVFNKIAGDSTNGYSKQGDEFVDTGKRYGLKVNGVEYFLGDDDYGNKSGTTGWFDFPVDFPLNAGVNTIDVFCYAGYRAYMYEFQLVGLPEEVNNHEHNGADAYQHDGTNHWHVCTAEGCPEEGGIYGVEAHTMTETAGQNSDGKAVTTRSCAACGAGNVGISMFDYSSITDGKAIGSDGKIDAGAALTYKLPVTAAGKVSIMIAAKMSNASHGTQSFDPTKYGVKVGGVAQTILLPTGKNYSGLGLTNTADTYLTFAEYTVTAEDVAAGEITVEFDHDNSSYRLLFAGEVRLAW